MANPAQLYYLPARVRRHMADQAQLRLEFEDDTAYEHLVLTTIVDAERTAAGRQSVGGWDLRAGRQIILVALGDSMGASHASEALRPMRILVFGAAYKVLDLLLEFTMKVNNEPFFKGASRWTMADKLNYATSKAPAQLPVPLNQQHWKALCALYSKWLEPRHSVVHRKAQLAPDGSLVGQDRNGNSLPPVTAASQDSFAETMSLVADSVINSVWARQGERRIEWLLDRLGADHGQAAFGSRRPVDPIPRIVLDLSELSAGRLHFDPRPIGSIRPPPTVADVELHGRVGGCEVVYVVPLEGVCLDSEVEFDPTDPAWAQHRMPSGSV